MNTHSGTTITVPESFGEVQRIRLLEFIDKELFSDLLNNGTEKLDHYFRNQQYYAEVINSQNIIIKEIK